MIKEVSWIFGTSAAGKETFVRKACASPAAFHALGWSATALAMCPSSIDIIGQYDGDPSTGKRDAILREATELLHRVDVVLVKWQIVDSEAARPQLLKAMLPNSMHRVIELRTPDSELIDRLVEKPWWDSRNDPTEYIQEERQLVADSIKVLGNDFESLVVDGSAQGRYSILD